jgi:predicted small secreted protein
MESMKSSRQDRSMKMMHAMLAAMFVGAIVGLAGCNTTEGVGRDIEAAGDAIEDAADDAKD